MQAMNSSATSHAGFFDHAPSPFSYARDGNGLVWIRPEFCAPSRDMRITCFLSNRKMPHLFECRPDWA